jgi:uncharacterized protein (TIGR02391 family)
MSNVRQLTESELTILQTVFDYFNKTGEWPKSTKLNLDLRKMGDFWKNAKTIGYEYIDAQENVEPSLARLTVLGMSVCKGSEDILNKYVRTVKLCVKEYIDGIENSILPENPKITGIGIHTDLPVKHDDLKKIVALLKGENRFSRGYENPDDPYSFKMTISKDILKFEEINTIQDYIKIANPWLFAEAEEVSEKRHDPWKYIPFHGNTDFSVGMNHEPTLSISELLGLLHPTICEICRELFESSHFSEAVEKGFKVVRDRLRKLTGFETGSDAFGGKGKLHIKGAAAPHVDQDFNDAAKFLCMAIDRFRNEASHTSDSRINGTGRAYEYLMLCSLAMNLLDDAEILSKENE